MTTQPYQQTVTADQWHDWHWQLSNRIEGPEALHAYLSGRGVRVDLSALRNITQRYRFHAVPYVLEQIDWDLPSDPIRQQCFPDAGELLPDPDGTADPFKESTQTNIPGLLHRFPDRALIMVNSHCAMTCRHCTRKNTLELDRYRPDAYSTNGTLDYLKEHTEIREVILSGGDPLLEETETLDRLLSALFQIKHVDVIRIGTRLPCLLPMRIDGALIDMLKRHRPIWLNTQFNHPRELTVDAISACERLVDAGIPVSNQSVLLKGINDDAEVLRELCCNLQRHRVRPYYVFACDPIAGIAHWRVPLERAVEIEDALKQRVGGLCMPLFVVDTPGLKGKQPIRHVLDGRR